MWEICGLLAKISPGDFSQKSEKEVVQISEDWEEQVRRLAELSVQVASCLGTLRLPLP